MKAEIYHCDECSAERKEANHWFVVVPSETGTKALSAWLTFYTWPTLATQASVKHICGQQCAQKVLDRWMTTGKL